MKNSKNKTKKKRGGALNSNFPNFKTAAIESAKHLGEGAIVGLHTGTRAARNVIKLTGKTTNVSIQTASMVIQGTLAVVSAIFGSLKSMFSSLPTEFDSIVTALETEPNDNLKSKLSRKLLSLFEGTTNRSQLKFKQLFAQFTNMDNRLRSQISFKFGQVGCKRKLTNKLFRNRFAHSSCKEFNGNKTSANKSLTLLINVLSKIKKDLKLKYEQLKIINKNFLLELDDALMKQSGSTSIKSFMKKYEASIKPIIGDSELLLSIENPDIVNLIEQFDRALLPSNVAANVQANVAANVQANVAANVQANVQANVAANVQANVAENPILAANFAENGPNVAANVPN
jgi:hypothetical protein